MIKQIDYAVAAHHLQNELTEHAFQRIIIDSLVDDAGYTERSSKTDYNPVYAMDTALLFDFLERTQPDEMAKLRAFYNGGSDATILNRISNKIAYDGLIRAIWDGVDFDCGVGIDLVYPRPTALFDKKSQNLYGENGLSIMEEVYHKDGERIDLVIFLNGLAIFTVELKCNTSASGDYRNAIRQYKEERDCTTRLLMPKVGALAHFAMDLSNVFACAELKGRESFFLPFNQGQPDGTDPHAVRAGNPHNPDGINTSYMWESIWTKDTIFDLLYDFVYLETKRDARGKKTGEQPIFPRFQQLRAVRRVSDDVQASPVMKNYLIEHSAGSGKTKTISWLAHKLASLYASGADELMYDKVIIVTDRKVVDKQLQNAVRDMAKDTGVVRVMDEKKTSTDLGRALSSSYRIVVSTIQKFLHLDPGVFADSSKRFAVIIDEAHGSTSGKSMAAVNAALSSDVEDSSSLDDLASFIKTDIALSSGQDNVTLIGFTATPTGKTLQQFGRMNEKGLYEAYDLYSMRQAVEEGFILDVTANYTTYDSYCRVVKNIADDPELEGKAAKRQLNHMVSTADGTINGNLAVMVEHFTGCVRNTIQGKAKAMIVTAGREEAVRYFLTYQKIRSTDMQRLGRCQALVAFTGEVKIDGETYTEAGLNGFPDDKTADVFDGDDYRLLIVADKYQTGFDQPKLCAMYVDKKLSGITAVQTLSRLNRMYYDKRTFVLDFRNSFEDIQKAFAPYFQSTILVDPLTIADVRETERRLTELDILDMDDVQTFNTLLAKPKQSNADKQKMWSLLDGSAKLVFAMEEAEADEARRVIRNFLKQYSFLLQVAPFEDKSMHMEYNFCTSLIRMIDADNGGGVNFNLSDKVRLEDFEVEKTGEYKGEKLESVPEVAIAKGTGTGLSEDEMEKLSKIIADWNARYGLSFDVGIAAGSLVSLKASLENDPKVRQSAKVNTKRDFENTIEDRASDALVEGYEQNVDWHKFLLGNEEARRQLLHAFTDDIYNSLKSNI